MLLLPLATVAESHARRGAAERRWRCVADSIVCWSRIESWRGSGDKLP